MLTSAYVMQPKGQPPLDQPAATEVGQAASGESQPPPLADRAPIASAAAQLDMQMSEVRASAGEASDLASTSANDMLTCNEKLSSMFALQAEPGQSARAGGTHDAASQSEEIDYNISTS